MYEKVIMFDYQELEEELKDLVRQYQQDNCIGQDSLIIFYWDNYIEPETVYDEDEEGSNTYTGNLDYQIMAYIYNRFPELKEQDFYMRIWW